MLEGNTFGECRRAQCPRVLPCTLEGCGRPRPDKRIVNLLGLYKSCKKRGALPESGGVMDQSVELMYWFDVIDAVVDEFEADKAERENRRWPT